MEQIKLQHLNNDAAPRTTEDSLYPNIDANYTVRQYTGERLVIRTSQNYGLKEWGLNMPSSMQGIAIYGDILVRVKNATTGHKIFQIGSGGNLVELASFNLNLNHANALQFAPELEAGQTFPYLYVVGLDNNCYVLSIAADYTVTLVQTITITGVSQILKGDDGYIWTSTSNVDYTRHFVKYRKVAVSEGDVTLTDDDILDSFDSTNIMGSSTYTAQGWKIRFGKIWYCYGASGAGQNRGIAVYDTANHRHVTTIDLSNYTTLEFEDVEFYDNALILATYSATNYMLRF